MSALFLFCFGVSVTCWLKTLFLSAPVLTDPSHPPTTATTPRNMKAWWRRCSTVTRYRTTHSQSGDIQPHVTWHGFCLYSDIYRFHVFICLIRHSSFGSRFRHSLERMRGIHTGWVGAQRTWTMWLYPPAPFTLGAYCQANTSVGPEWNVKTVWTHWRRAYTETFWNSANI